MSSIWSFHVKAHKPIHVWDHTSRILCFLKEEQRYVSYFCDRSCFNYFSTSQLVNIHHEGSPWQHTDCSGIYNTITLVLDSSPLRSVLNTTWCDRVCQWLVPGQWFSLYSPISSITIADCHDMSNVYLVVRGIKHQILKFHYVILDWH